LCFLLYFPCGVLGKENEEKRTLFLKSQMKPKKSCTIIFPWRWMDRLSAIFRKKPFIMSLLFRQGRF